MLRRCGFGLVLTAMIACLPGWSAAAAPLCPPALSAKIPPRPAGAMGGAQFIDQLAAVSVGAREAAVVAELLSGNIPEYLRQLAPVRLTRSAAGRGGQHRQATICVTPDFMAIGSNDDFVRVPMDLHSSLKVAKAFGFVLPTRKMVNAIHRQADYRFRPQPQPPGAQMSSPGYYVAHNSRIRSQRRQDSVPLGALVAGHKKTVVLTNRLNQKPGRIAIYGWLRRDGSAIQPLSTVHGAGYADYSHGIRLVSESVLIGDQHYSIYDAFADPELAVFLSREGVIEGFRELMDDARQGEG